MTARARSGVVGGGAVALGFAIALLTPGAAAAQIDGWQLDAIKAAQAQEVSTGEGVVVAVLDTGVGEHPDLEGRVLDGKSFVDGDPRRDQDGHGSDIAAQVLSVAPDAKILPIQVTTGGDEFTFAPAVEGIRWAVDNGAQVINISLAGSVATDDAINAIQYALDKGVPVIAGTGNDPSAEVGSPAYLPGVVAVSGFGESGELWDGATTGPETVLSAPAENIQGIIPDGPGTDAGYRDGGSGTSIATALTSGAAALVKAKFPDASAADVVNRLITTAEDAGAPGRDDEYGFGKLDAYAAVTADVAPVAANPLGEPKSALSQTSAVAEEDSTGGLTPGVLIGAVAGGVLLVVAVIVVIVVLNRRGRRKAPPQPGPYTYPPPPAR
ncbi:S8 family serine peptidase [Phytomonospora sp. NPDC050363]|uniref:S8 family serine peptidase n=1 Tax=Phytomonospora sp. NPDC050363 TaxID=3155642 RepID=UPI0033EACD50